MSNDIITLGPILVLKRRTSTSKPAKNSRNDNPNVPSVFTSSSGLAQPSAAGPIKIPASISRTGPGSRNLPVMV